MSFRPVRLLPVALVGLCLATSVVARTKHTSSHHGAAHAGGPALIWRGDVTVAHGVVDDMAKAWQRAGRGSVTVQPFNTASGLDAVRLGSADIAGAARGASMDPNEAGLTFTPVAWDALVMVTHPSNPVSSLTLKQLHDIYYGKITNWSQVGGRNEPIDVNAVASPADGVEYSLRTLLFGRGNQPVAAPRQYLNTTSLQQGIALDTKGLGATTLSNVVGNPKLKMLRIDGVAPTRANVANGSYPLYTPLYLITRSSGPKAAQAQAFVDFANSPTGAEVIRRHDLVPYQDGAMLASMDASRRGKILAEVGARAVAQPTATPIAAPGATYAAGAARAPTSERTLAARQALEERRAHDAQEKADEAGRASLAGVDGQATTVESSSDQRFARVDASASQPQLKGKSYKVGRGDTLSSIAHKHSVTVADLRRWNHLRSDSVKPGQVLVVSPR
ncbi:substrate-binding domain-containing protein [Dyella ginsengisoli]|uniref:substrate-binding domain-containing protein n=1 Tax=Dyella ginsengisoli TaxID=363848 RepID=UPI000344A2F3|nr:substrate-binding domain-containing protein [Dyella ginsengisoli]